MIFSCMVLSVHPPSYQNFFPNDLIAVCQSHFALISFSDIIAMFNICSRTLTLSLVTNKFKQSEVWTSYLNYKMKEINISYKGTNVYQFASRIIIIMFHFSNFQISGHLLKIFLGHLLHPFTTWYIFCGLEYLNTKLCLFLTLIQIINCFLLLSNTSTVMFDK